MSSFEEKLKEIRNNLVEVVAKRIEGSIPTKEYDEAYNGFVDQIKQLISETIGEDEVKRDVPPNKNDSYESLNAQFKVMKYNQEKLPIVNELKKELRHAFNLNGE